MVSYGLALDITRPEVIKWWATFDQARRLQFFETCPRVIIQPSGLSLRVRSTSSLPTLFLFLTMNSGNNVIDCDTEVLLVLCRPLQLFIDTEVVPDARTYNN